MAQQPDYQNHFRAIRLFQSSCQRLADPLSSEILVLDVDLPFCAGDHVEIERFDFTHFRLRWRARYGAGDRDRHIGYVWNDFFRPWITDSRNYRYDLSRGIAPARSGKFAQGLRRLATDHQHCIVKRRVWTAIDQPSGLIGPMLAGIPAPIGQIQSAGKCDRVVYDDHFLMVRTGDRMGVVVTQMNAMPRSPAQTIDRRDFPVRAVHHWVIPIEHIDIEMTLASDQKVQEVSQQRGVIAGILFA